MGVGRKPAGLGWVLLATVVSGYLYSRAFPTAAVRPVAWVALVPFLLAVRHGGPRRAVGLGALFMLVLAYGVNDWFPRAVSRYYAQPAHVGFAFFLGVTLLTAAPASMGFAWAYQRLTRRPSAGLPFAAAAAWVAGELARTEFLGDPWVLFGYSQVGNHRLVQIADATGVYGVSFVLVAVNVAVAEAVGALVQQAGRKVWVGLAAAGALAVAVLAYGAWRLRQFDTGAATGGQPVLLVQGNLDRESQWDVERQSANLYRYLELTGQALAERKAASGGHAGGASQPRVPAGSGDVLVVWPENAVTFFLDDEAEYRASIAGVLTAGDAKLIAGGPRSAQHDPAIYHNTAFLLNGAGQITAWYDKLQLLPFAEYFPLSGLDFMRRRFGQVREFTPGPPSLPLPTPAGRAGVIICNEALFSGPARERVRAGAEVLLTLANDSWVGEPKYTAQAFDMAVLRAVEQRRYLLRVSTSGPSAIVAATGRLAARSGPATAATLAGAVEPRNGLTVYARFGDLFAASCTGAVLWLLAAGAIGRRTERV